MKRKTLYTAFGSLLAATIVLLLCQNTLAQDEQTSITIEKTVVCQDVVDRQPVGVGEVFPREIEKIFCFTKVVGAQGETTITHNWYYNGNLKASIVLPVRSSNWRTWSSKKMDQAWTGEWMVEILAADGTALDSVIFYLR